MNKSLCRQLPVFYDKSGRDHLPMLALLICCCQQSTNNRQLFPSNHHHHHHQPIPPPHCSCQRPPLRPAVIDRPQPSLHTWTMTPTTTNASSQNEGSLWIAETTWQMCHVVTVKVVHVSTYCCSLSSAHTQI